MSILLQGGISTVGGAGAGALSGAALGSVVPGIGTGIGALVGGIAGALPGISGLFSKDDSSSAVSYEDMLTANLYNYNQERALMQYQSELNQQLQEQNFNYNKWFAQNNLINSYRQLEQLGINPLLMSPQGSGGSVGSSAVSLGQTSNFDPTQMVTANANSAQAKVARLNAGINLMNGLTDIAVKYANSSKMLEEAQTEQSKRDLNASQTRLNDDIDYLKQLEGVYAPEKYKSEIREIISKAMLNEVRATYEPEVQRQIAKATETSAEASYINATQGSPTKIIADYLNLLFGDGKGNPIKNTFGAVRKGEDNKYNTQLSDYERLFGKYR